ncbi:Na/Pi cotransporter family protein [Candidatus Woesearchaeota archaeon]|nr:MAG: Na/Pi cotransporter family protein [Candidatus Woesearchaeota archaeon]
MINFSIIFTVLTGLIIFIYAIEHFSKEILAASGERFRNLLRRLIKNRFSSTFVGIIFTALVQSSTATTVITASLVSAGLISFAQSLGIIFGANIGTTITAQLIALKLTSFAPYFIVIGFFISIFGKNYKYVGKVLFYFGLVFFGLTLVSDAIAPLKNDPAIINMFANTSNMFFALIAGFIFTVIVQSSSVTSGIVIILATNGLLSLEQSIPLLLGANIGTTATTLIASSKLNLFAKRSAMAHAFFNIGGALLLLPLIKPFVKLITYLGGSTAQQVANAHTIFNVGVALLFLILLTPFKKLIEYIVKGDEEEILLEPKYLKNSLPKSTKKSFELIEKELAYSLDTTSRMYDKAIANLKMPTAKLTNQIEKFEALSDLLDEKIEVSLLELSRRELDENEAKRIVMLVRLSNAIEQLSDFAEDLSNLPKSENFQASEEAMLGIDLVYVKLRDYFDLINDNFLNLRKKKIDINIESIITKSYARHVKIIKNKTTYAPSLFVESLSLMEGAVNKLKEIAHLSVSYEELKRK